MLWALSPDTFQRHARYQRNAISDRRYPGVHSLVRSVSLKLPASGRNDAGTWCDPAPISATCKSAFKIYQFL